MNFVHEEQECFLMLYKFMVVEKQQRDQQERGCLILFFERETLLLKHDRYCLSLRLNVRLTSFPTIVSFSTSIQISSASLSI